MVEGDRIPPQLLSEVAGTPRKPVPMTEDQAYYLHTVVDPEINRLITNMQIEKASREAFKVWERRQFSGADK